MCVNLWKFEFFPPIIPKMVIGGKNSERFRNYWRKKLGKTNRLSVPRPRLALLIFPRFGYHHHIPGEYTYTHCYVCGRFTGFPPTVSAAIRCDDVGTRLAALHGWQAVRTPPPYGTPRLGRRSFSKIQRPLTPIAHLFLPVGAT